MTTVYHLPNSKRSSSDGWQTKSSQPRAYHTDPACRYISGDDRVRDSTVAKAENRGLEPCRVCAQDEKIDTSMGTTTCPLCGETATMQLAKHIRHRCTAR